MISTGIESQGLFVQHIDEAFCLFLFFLSKDKSK